MEKGPQAPLFFGYCTKRSGLAAFLDAGLVGTGLGALDVSPLRQALVAQHAQGFYLGALAWLFGEFEHFDIARTRFAIFVDGADFLGQWAPQYQQFSDVLDGRCVHLVGQGLEHLLAFAAVIVENTDLDQAMGVECCVNFLLDIGSQTIGADHDDRVQVVRFGAVFLALGRGKLYLSHGQYYRLSPKIV